MSSTAPTPSPSAPRPGLGCLDGVHLENSRAERMRAPVGSALDAAALPGDAAHPPLGKERLKVLLVEDIATVAAAMRAALQALGMSVEIAATGAEAIVQKASFRPDVVLVDLELPDMNGMTLVERFSTDADCGVIVLTANDQSAMRVSGLHTGADDYVVKPASPLELAARIHALHRRMTKPAAVHRLRIFVHPAQRCLITAQGERVLMTEAEMTALETLIDAGGSSVSREWLSRVALKRPLNSDDRAVDQLVMKIRRKIAGLGASERVILSARRQGYVIAEPALFSVMRATVLEGLRG